MERKNGLRDGLAIGLGYYSVSLAFGVLAVGKGLSWIEAILISFFNLTSAGQFAGLTIMTTAGGLVEMALSQLLINARYSLMGIALSQKLEPKFTNGYRAVLGFAITDEIFAVSVGQKEVTRKYFAWLTVLPILGWTLGTLSGALLGNILPEMVVNALGLALYGMFVAIVLPVAKKERNVLIVVLIGMAVSTLFYYAPVLKEISSGFSVIICTVIAAALGAWLMPVPVKEAE